MLEPLRVLADKQENGYGWDDGLLFRYSLDQLGNQVKKLCVPVQLRTKCMTLAHEGFGHRGKNKVGKELSHLFYWPHMWSDIAGHCRSCRICQEHSKARPRQSLW